MAHLIIEFNDGTERDKYMDDDMFRIKDNMLIISKGRYAPSLYINLQNVKSFHAKDR